MGNPRGVKRDFEALESRRLKAAKLLKAGWSQAEVAGCSPMRTIAGGTGMRERGAAIERSGPARAAAASARPAILAWKFDPLLC